jgi:hypothetical protein
MIRERDEMVTEPARPAAAPTEAARWSRSRRDGTTTDAADRPAPRDPDPRWSRARRDAARDPTAAASPTRDPTRWWMGLREARALSTRAGRGSSADSVIGEMLGRAPIDPDGFWPPVAIRDAIESTRSRDLERGIARGRFNSRGVTTRSPGDGGQLEREEAAFYRASSQAVASKWLRTSALLERIAKDYESMAIKHDQDAERLEWRR